MVKKIEYEQVCDQIIVSTGAVPDSTEAQIAREGARIVTLHR
jgi:hypothetical protein